MEEDNHLAMISRTQRPGSPTTQVIGPRSRPQADNGTLVRASSSRDVATEGLRAQTGAAQHGSFFQSSRNVAINGGEFHSSRLHHTNLTINFNHSGNEDSVEIDRSDPAPSLKTSPHDQDYGPQIGPHLSADLGSSQRVEDQERYTRNIQLDHSPLPVRKSSDLYYRHLATRGRGSPLWIPEPNRNLPIEYQRKGISIGDVGILTDDGSFDFLFNVCLPQGDPINPEEMPEDFHPLKAPGERDIRKHLEFKANSYLASSSVKSSQRDGDSFGLTFESSASEGAVLTMPRGSISRDLTNKITFKKYASANVVKWYRYVNEVCGREANNGDVRLVVGINPATAWGMATFANLSAQSAFLLRFKPLTGERSLGPPYGWEYSGTAEVKSGPDTEEIDTLRQLDREAGQEGSDEYENQTLFVRTINVTIQGDTWNKLSAEWEELYLDDDSKDSATDQGDHSFDTQNSSSNLTGSGSGMGNRGGASDKAPQEGSPSFKRHKRFQSVYLSELPSAIASHPSKIMNRLLLERKPNSSFAITEDDEWISVIKESDKVLPPPETLFSRILETHDICDEEGVVFFQPKNAQNNEAVRQIDVIPADLHFDSKVDEIVREDSVFGSPRNLQVLEESISRVFLDPESSENPDNTSVAQRSEVTHSRYPSKSPPPYSNLEDTVSQSKHAMPDLQDARFSEKRPLKSWGFAEGQSSTDQASFSFADDDLIDRSSEMHYRPATPSNREEFIRIWSAETAVDVSDEYGRLSSFPSKKMPLIDKWKAYTMEAAKWAFSTTQLDTIVSQAILQAADTSSVRLLQPEAVEEEIPAEIRRLEAQRADAQTRYNILRGRRLDLLEALSTTDTGKVDDTGNGDRFPDLTKFVRDLKALNMSLDHLAKEMVTLSNQISYLNTLVHDHNHSALTVAFQNLNSSNRALHARNQALEAGKGPARGAESTAGYEREAADTATASWSVLGSQAPSGRGSSTGDTLLERLFPVWGQSGSTSKSEETKPSI